MRYHINDEGKPMRCVATERPCKFGESEGGLGHYPSRLDAAKVYERHMAANYTNTLTGVKVNKGITYDAPFKDAIEEERALREHRDQNKDFNRMAAAKHMNYVEKTLAALVASKKTTEHTHARQTDNGDLIFNAERVKAHTEIIDEILEKSKNIPAEGKALFAGGLGGAGKSTVLGGHANIKQSDYVTLNPDDIKEIMANKGLIPKVKGLTPMEASPLVHEEASHITSVIFEKLRAEKKNIIFDITMSSLGSVQNRINHLNRAGYNKVEAIFVDIRPETSFERGEYRYKEGLSDYLKNNKGNGGRFLPKYLTEAQKTEPESNYKSKNAENFIAIQKLGGFTNKPRVFDNDVFGRDPQEIDFDNFRDKELTNSF